MYHYVIDLLFMLLILPIGIAWFHISSIYKQTFYSAVFTRSWYSSSTINTHSVIWIMGGIYAHICQRLFTI